MLSGKFIALLLENLGVTCFYDIVTRLRECGFDEDSYLAANVDLQNAGHDASSALFHFLVYGVDEGRLAALRPLPEGLEGIAALEIPNPQYKQRLIRGIFRAQLDNPETADRLWNDIDGEFVDRLRLMGAVPYYVIGDSHADRYLRMATVGRHWLAPLPLVCPGASAIGLASEASQTRYGAKILQWARRIASREGGLNVPVFLKFGGLDAEFLWMSRQIEKGVYRFPVSEFCEFAERSVERYAAFLDALSDIIGARPVRVCSVFPSVLPETSWASGFLSAFGGSPEYNQKILENLSVVPLLPSLRLRTRYRGIYNTFLKQMCKTRGLVFIDDFSPLLGPDGILDPIYAGEDFHIDYGASEEPLVRIIRSFVALDAGREPAAAAPSQSA